MWGGEPASVSLFARSLALPPAESLSNEDACVALTLDELDEVLATLFPPLLL